MGGSFLKAKMMKFDINGVPDFQSLMLPVLRICQGSEVRIRDVADQLASELALSDAALAVRNAAGTQTVFYNRMNWAKTHLAKAGLVKNTRWAHFQITERGCSVLSTNPERIDMAFLTQFAEFRDFTGRATKDASAETVLVETERTPDEVIRAAQAELEEALSDDLLERVRSASPAFFESLIVKLLLTIGYGVSGERSGRVLGRTGDDGVDGVIEQDALGLDRIYVQAKRYSETNIVGPSAIRDFFGSLDRHKAPKGLFVTTSSFSKSARETADYLSKRIALVDGDGLAKLMIKYNVGCQTHDMVELKKIDEDFFQ